MEEKDNMGNMEELKVEQEQKQEKDKEEKQQVIDRILKKQKRIKEQENLIKLLKNQRENEKSNE